MPSKVSSIEQARFDTRLSKEQKTFFERAASIGGYRSLTDFVILTVQEKAKQIIKEKEAVIASEKDSEVFFDAIMNPPKPNNDLIAAFEEYNSQLLTK
jgi:uncharacterized protein (DUF1778 family)